MKFQWILISIVAMDFERSIERRFQISAELKSSILKILPYKQQKQNALI